MGKKNAYVQYDYEEAYRNHAEQMNESMVQEMIRSGQRKMVYATKEIRSGEQLEVEIYPEFKRGQRSQIPDAGLRKKQRDAQWNLNEKNSRKQCERVINANFGDRDIWATFTYTDEQMPETMEQAQRNMQNYIRRLNNRRKKAGLQKARYVYVTECSDKGRWHHHIVMDGDMDMDTVEKVWTAGKRNEIRRLNKDENGLTGMAKYITKEKKKKSQKKWSASKGLKKPAERVNHYKFKGSDVRKIARNHNCLESMMVKWYGKEGYVFTSQEIRYNDINGQWYIYARMRKPAGKGEEKCRTQNRGKGRTGEGAGGRSG